MIIKHARLCDKQTESERERRMRGLSVTNKQRARRMRGLSVTNRAREGEENEGIAISGGEWRRYLSLC